MPDYTRSDRILPREVALLLAIPLGISALWIFATGWTAIIAATPILCLAAYGLFVAHRNATTIRISPEGVS